MITSEGCDVVNDTEQEVTYPHPFLALPSSVGGLEEDVELVVEEDVELVVEEDVAGCKASVMTPKSAPCAVPNAIVAEDNGLEAISYCA